MALVLSGGEGCLSVLTAERAVSAIPFGGNTASSISFSATAAIRDRAHWRPDPARSQSLHDTSLGRFWISIAATPRADLCSRI